jgi:hypothetical protein
MSSLHQVWLSTRENLFTSYRTNILPFEYDAIISVLMTALKIVSVPFALVAPE